MLPRQQLAFGAEAGEDKQHGGEAFAALPLDSSIEYGYQAITCLALLLDSVCGHTDREREGYP